MSRGAAARQLRRPQELYEQWERSHWSAHEVDLSRDGADWAALAERERALLYWVLSSLMVAEERISTQFCGLVLAQDDEEEGSYLSSQLVDEVRHMQFYARYQDEAHNADSWSAANRRDYVLRSLRWFGYWLSPVQRSSKDP